MNRDNYSVLKLEKSKLFGNVSVSGAKNSVLRLLAASILSQDEIVITNFPNNMFDVKIHVQLLEKLGKVCIVNEEKITIKENKIKNELHWDGWVIRNTLLILGALVARTGKGSVPIPGGCNIGNGANGRGYDLHIYLLKQLGADVWESGDTLYAEAKNGLIGNDIFLPIRSTGATENSIIAGSLAKGITKVWNPHIRPEILDLISFLRKMGVIINVFGQEHIEIHGIDSLSGCEHEVIPDNVEALTWLIGTAITNGEVEIENFPFEHLEIPLIHLRESGVKIYKCIDSVIVKNSNCFPIDISTGPYPGINSDMQPLLAVFGASAKGESRLVDLRFPGRYGYAEELRKMGLEYKIKDNLLNIIGGKRLTGCSVRALDLRAGAALSLAGMVADGVTEIQDAWQIIRGYNNYVEKIVSLGGNAQWS